MDCSLCSAHRTGSSALRRHVPLVNHVGDGSHHLPMPPSRMRLAAPPLTRLLDDLVKDGLILRERSTLDRRQILLKLTQRGAKFSRELLASVNSVASPTQIEAIERLSLSLEQFPSSAGKRCLLWIGRSHSAGWLGYDVRQTLLDQIGQLAGSRARTTAAPVYASANQHPPIGTFAGIIGIVVLVVGATTVFAQLQVSLNLIWGIRAHPGNAVWGWLHRRVLSVGVPCTTSCVSPAASTSSAKGVARRPTPLFVTRSALPR